ncbi:MAG: DUF5686 family protein [Bacillota bacterium]
MRSSLLYCFFLSALFPVFIFAQTFRIEGTVYDKSNRKPLSYATVQLKASTSGTTTNNQGKFTLDLPFGEHSLIVSYIGYKSAEVGLKIPYSGKLEFFLEPLSIMLPEIVIGSDDEDPAYRIIRNAIKNKEANRKILNNLQYDEYRKAIFKSAGQIASVEESFIKGFKSGEKESDFVLASFKTENIKKDNNSINVFKQLKMDFYKDTIIIFGNKVHMPLSPAAFDYYRFKLLNTRNTESNMVYSIEVIPRSEIRPLFRGLVLIEDSSFALVGVDLKSNNGMTVPFIKDLSFRFTENKIRMGSLWFPQYLESHISLGVSLAGLLSVEKMELEQFRSFSNQKINYSEIDTSAIFKNNPFLDLGLRDSSYADSLKKLFKPVMLVRSETDSLRPIPLNENEIAAFKDLDSTKKPMTMLKTSGVLSSFANTQKKSSGNSSPFLHFLEKAADNLFNYLSFKNTRTSGISLGANYNSTIDSLFSFGLSGLYSFGLKKPEGKGFIGFNTGNKKSMGIHIGFFDYVNRWNHNSQFTELMNTFSVTLGLEDNFNYLRSKGYNISIKQNWKDSLSAEIGFVSEKQTSLTQLIHHRIFNSRFAKRINPAIKEGMDNRLRLNFIAGSDPFNFQFMPQSGFTLTADLSLKELGGNFGYLRTYSACQIRFNTFFKELFFPPFMLIRLEGGIVKGNFGLQHILSPDAALTFVSPFGVFKAIKPYDYTGDKMTALHVEHNWRGIIFQSIGLKSLTDMNMGITTGASFLKTWDDSELKLTESNKPVYWEAYMGITGIYGVIRVDGAYNSNKIFAGRLGFTLSL